MNIRTTTSVNETLLEILISYRKRKVSTAMYLDANGFSRAEGLIKAIFLDVPKPYVELESGVKIIIKTIKVVNGYSVQSF